MMRSNILRMIASVLLAGSMSANAAPLAWNLQGVTFDDGGTAAGSFVYDADTQTYSAINIQTTGNLAFTYATGNLVGWAKSGFTVATGSFVGAGFLDLMMVSDLTGAGGTIALGPNGVFTVPFETTYEAAPVPSIGGGGVQLNYTTPPLRYITGGYVTSVPEPATFAQFGFGLLSIGVLWRRKLG